MKERAKELKAEERIRKDKAKGEKALLEKIAEMPEPDRSMAARVHEIIKASGTRAFSKDLVWDARIRQPGRQGDLLLPESAEIQCQIRNPRLQ